MISIIIPVFNSEKTIEILVNDIVKTIDKNNNFEVILINDCSEDKSEEICKNLVEKNSNVLLSSLSKNVGEHNAIMAGLNACNGDYAVIMSDDLQNSTSSLLELIKYGIQEKDKSDVIYTYYDKVQYSFFKKLGSKFNSLVSNILLDKPKFIYLSSFKFINRFLIKEIIKYKSPYIFIDGIILGITSRIGRLKVKHDQRAQGKSGYTFLKMLQLWSNMSTSFSVLPLRISMLIGLILSIFGFILAAYFFIQRIMDDAVPGGFASIFVSVTIFSGTILIALGLVGEYVGRIFISLNKKPQFIIRNSWSNKKK